MKNQEPPTNSEIQKMAANTFVSLHPDKIKPENQYAKIKIGTDYTDLFGKLDSLLCVVMSAIEAKDANAPVHHKNDDILQVLEVAKEFIPYPEIEFLDNVYKRIVRK